MMKILYVITGLKKGGAERLVIDLANWFSSEGHEVSLIYLTGEQEYEHLSPAVEVKPLGLKKWQPFTLLKGFFRYFFYVKKFEPDVINSHMFHANIFCRLTHLFFRKIFLVCSVQNTTEGGELVRISYRLTSKLGDVFTNSSVEAVEFFENSGCVKKGMMTPVLSGIDVDTFCFSAQKRSAIRKKYLISSGKWLFIAVGRLEDQKGYFFLLQAIAELEGSLDFMLLIVGDGYLRQDLEKYTKFLGIEDSVHFAGKKEDIAGILSGGDLFILSSKWEGFGLVVAEAMACELPVVATDCGGVREVIGNAGYLVPSEDSNALLRAIKLVTMRPRCERLAMGVSGRERILRFYSIDAAARRYYSVYLGHKSCAG